MSIHEAIGARVRSIREQRKLDQPELADALGVSQAHMSRLENGAKWSADQMEAAAAALGVRMADLLPDAKPPDLGPMLSVDELLLIDALRARRGEEFFSRAVEQFQRPLAPRRAARQEPDPTGS